MNKKKIAERFLSLFGDDRDAIAELFGTKATAVSDWKSGRKGVPWKNLEYTVEKKGVSWDWLLTGKSEGITSDKSDGYEIESPLPDKVGADHVPRVFAPSRPQEHEPIDIVFNLQKYLADLLSILADAGRDIAVGQSLKTYRGLPGLIETIRGLKALCESISERLEAYPQRAKNHEHGDQDRPA